jgi:peptidoglycan hydrolase CwlO-like protein
MKRKNIVLTIFLGVFSLSFFFGLSRYYEKPVIAQTSCPSYMVKDSYECYNYLVEQLELLQSRETNIQKELEQEEYEQLSLEEKIDYINGQIAQTQRTITSLEIQVASKDIEIKLLEKSILEKEDNLSVLGQEINTLQGSVMKRVTEAYKYSFIGPLELFLDTKSFSSVLRKTKYLAETRSQDKRYLGEYNEKVAVIEEEEAELEEERASLQSTRNALEEEKIELAQSRDNLESQRYVREGLLAESKARQAELLEELKRNKQIQAELDKVLQAYINAHINDMKYRGPVEKGDPIGTLYPYASKCSGSTGPHLHFGISTISSGGFYANVDIYKGGYLVMGEPSGKTPAPDGWTWNFVHPGAYAVPLLGSDVYITQDYHEVWPYNYKEDWPDEPYFYATDLSRLSGAAYAVVLAAEEGILYTYTDPCNQDYAIINHPNGYRSIYVHMLHRE